MCRSNITMENTFFDELELIMIILFVVDDIGRNLNGKIQVVLIDIMINELSFQPWDANDNGNNNIITIMIRLVMHDFNGNDNHNFGAMNNDFDYVDFDNFGTPLLQQQKQKQEHQASGQQKMNASTNKKSKIRITIKICMKITRNWIIDFNMMIYKYLKHVHCMMVVACFLFFYFPCSKMFVGTQGTNETELQQSSLLSFVRATLDYRNEPKEWIIFGRQNL